MRRLLLATGNPGKVAELRDLLGPDVTVLTPRELGLHLDVEESGATFRENAVIKAQAFCAASGEVCVADDSGLCVDALGGAPGVRSARFARDAGRGAGDLANRAYLLERMAHVPEPARGAHFSCAIAVAVPGTSVQVFEGACHGRITLAPRGDSGFGYDPLFEWENGRTFAELGLAEKQAVSHRGRALRAALPHLTQLVMGAAARRVAGNGDGGHSA